jgi:hypothetical protein
VRRTKTKRIGKIILSVIAVIMLIVTLTSLDSATMTVEAASLKHIDEIVAQSGTFNILEIVPDKQAASFGYYIDGQEPITSADFDTYQDGTTQINGWKATLTKKTSPADRTSFVNDLFSRLKAKGVLGDIGVTAAPLQNLYYNNNSYYTESYLPGDVPGGTQLLLSKTESKTVNGTFTPTADGDYRAEYNYTSLAANENGGYVQNISRFEYTADPTESGTYYYSPTFSLITTSLIASETDLSKWDNVAVYTKTNEIYSVDPEHITVADILENGGFDAKTEYYYVNPSQTGSPGSFNYAAIVDKTDNDDAPGDGFIAATSGPSYFKRIISSYTYVGTGGSYTYSATGSDSNTVNFNSVYYKGGFTNNNLFKQLVFGLNSANYDALNVTVTVRTASEVTAADISTAGMIYVSSGTDIAKSGMTTSYTAEDIPDARAVDLYNYAANQNPVIIDYAIVKGVTAPADNIQKLCLLCLQSTITATTQTSLSGLTVDTAKLAYITSDADKTFVNNNIFCFNAFNTDSTAAAPDISSPKTNDIFTIVSSLYNQSFASGVYTSGFSDVLAEIQNENFLKQIAGQTNLLPENVTVSASVRHIINYKGRRQTNAKTSIKVLDLEPAKVTSATWLTPATVQSWITDPITKTTLPASSITIVHMTTGEFAGKIEDINETYDMVYIGASTEALNTSSGSTVYNDSNMNGLIYSNIGDTYYASLELTGIRSQDYVTVNNTKAINGGTGTTANKFRFSGNDITKTKVADLKKFAMAGYPIVVADSLVTGSAINGNTVDNSSYMYEALSGTFGTYANVINQGYAVNNDTTVIKYLNVSKPAVNITTKPVDYASDSSASITVDSNDGYYYLKYVFSISNVTDSTPISTTYDCRLYIDLNADGRYSDNEELSDIEVHQASDGTLVLPLTDTDGKEYYALSADIQYQVTRQMPSTYVGIIPWKLEVIKNGADQIHASSQGYTRIASVNAETIKVLQIMQVGTTSSKLNLAQQLTVNASGSNIQLQGKDGKYYTGIYGKLIADLADFKVTIDTVETSTLEAKGDSATIQAYLNDYDMVIIGFNDCYDGIQPNSAAAIVNYINSGKSVLFTHDTTSLTQLAKNYPEVTSTKTTLNSTDVLWNIANSEYKSIDNAINWYGDYSTTSAFSIKQYSPTVSNPTYVVMISSNSSFSTEAEYFNARVGTSIYKLTGSTLPSPMTNPASYAAFKSITGSAPVIYVYCSAVGSSSWYGSGYNNTGIYNLTATCNLTKFTSTKYTCTGLTYKSSNGSKSGSTTYLKTTDYAQIFKCLFNDSTPDTYTVVGKYNSAANTYTIGSATLHPSTTSDSFPQSELYADSLGTLSYRYSIWPWGIYFNSIIRDAVGLDRYGVTSSVSVNSSQTLGSIVNVNAPMSSDSILAVLNNSRSVPYTPKSGKTSTVNEYQGYTNYNLINVQDSPAPTQYKNTNNTYTSGTNKTTAVSQVNKGQITTYPYNVNTANFGGNDSSIISSGTSYMQIGLTHEQYFQINMNTDDIVVWYCLSSGGGTSSFYNDVPNDCVNAYYIYNKGNVTYSGVGHSSDASLYTGSSIGQEYINEAKLFVNTMIAAYQSAAQAPTIAIKRDARGTSDVNDKYVLNDDAATDNSVLSADLSQTDDSRAVYYRLSDPNVGVDKKITVSYYIADASGTTVSGIDEPVLLLAADDHPNTPLTTYNTNDVAVTAVDVSGVLETRLKGGYVYKFYLPNTNCLDKLSNSSVYSIKVYIKVTTMIGTTSLQPAVDSIEIKKQQLFTLS